MTTDLRCTACGSLVRPGAGWCSLCHEDLRSEEEQAAARAQARPWEAEVAEAEAAEAEAAGDEAAGIESARTETAGTETADETVTVAAGSGRHRRHAAAAAAGTGTATATAPRPDIAPADASAEATASQPATLASASLASLASLADAGIDVDGMLELLAANEPHPLGPLHEKLADKTTRIVAVLVAVSVLTGLSLLIMFLLGSRMH